MQTLFYCIQHGFEPPPLFVVFPHSTQPIGSKRWKAWQSYLTSMGKVHYVQVPEHVSSPLHWVTPTECVHSIIAEAYSKIEEVYVCNICDRICKKGLPHTFNFLILTIHNFPSE